MCLYLHGQSVLFCRSRHKDHVDEKHQVPSNPTLLDVIAGKDTYGNVDLSYASGLERADSTKIQGRADHDPARCFFMVDIPMFIWETDKTAVLTQKNECKVLMMSAFLGSAGRWDGTCTSKCPPAPLIWDWIQHLQQLSIDASHRPHVNLLIVVVLTKYTKCEIKRSMNESTDFVCVSIPTVSLYTIPYTHLSINSV